MDDPFVDAYDASELEIAAEFLTNWLPFLTRGLCSPCSAALRRRVLSLRRPDPKSPPSPLSPGPAELESPYPVGGFADIEPSGWGTDPEPPWPAASASSPKAKMSWADMAQEDELEEEARKSKDAEEEDKKGKKRTELSREQREYIRFMNVGRKKDFICLERVNKKIVNILDGLELHTGIFSAAEQKRIVDFVYELQEKGRNGQLGERTYSEPQKWMRGKGRVTIQFGCCYNYATDRYGNPPGILRDVVSDPIPPLFKVIIRRLVQWHVLPTTCVPDSCIVNIYEPGDCIPPHIDNHDFVRPFTTVSFLSECNILFGSDLKIEGAGEFSGSIAIPLPVGSVLVLNGNAADVAKHCVPAVPTKRISITFRKMDDSKWPFGFNPEPDLQNIQPLPYDSTTKRLPQLETSGPHQQTRNRRHGGRRKGSRKEEMVGKAVGVEPQPDSQDGSPLLPNPESTPRRWPHETQDGNRASGSRSMDKRKEITRRSYESKQMSDSHFRYGAEQLAGPSVHREAQAEAEQWSSDRDGSSESAGRRVRVEQNRIVVSRNVVEGDAPVRSSDQAMEPSQVHIRTLDKSGRRVRVSLSDH